MSLPPSPSPIVRTAGVAKMRALGKENKRNVARGAAPRVCPHVPRGGGAHREGARALRVGRRRAFGMDRGAPARGARGHGRAPRDAARATLPAPGGRRHGRAGHRRVARGAEGAPVQARFGAARALRPPPAAQAVGVVDCTPTTVHPTGATTTRGPRTGRAGPGEDTRACREACRHRGAPRRAVRSA